MTIHSKNYHIVPDSQSGPTPRSLATELRKIADWIEDERPPLLTIVCRVCRAIAVAVIP